MKKFTDIIIIGYREGKASTSQRAGKSIYKMIKEKKLHAQIFLGYKNLKCRILR